MPEFIIVETDRGLAIAQQPVGYDAVETAAANSAVLVDGGPYRSYEDAYDVLLNTPVDAEEESEEEIEGTPGG